MTEALWPDSQFQAVLSLHSPFSQKGPNSLLLASFLENRKGSNWPSLGHVHSRMCAAQEYCTMIGSSVLPWLGQEDCDGQHKTHGEVVVLQRKGRSYLSE